MRKIAPLLLITFIAETALAGILTLTPGQGSIEGVNVADSATAVIDGRTTELAHIGAGLRRKKVALAWVKVYVGQLFVSEPQAFVRDEASALESLDSVKSVALLFTFVRDVEAVKVETAFADSFVANGYDVRAPHIAAFLDAVAAGGDALAGKPIAIVGERLPDGTEAVTYEDNHGRTATINGPAGFVRSITALWLGQPTDQGVRELKTRIVRGN